MVKWYHVKAFNKITLKWNYSYFPIILESEKLVLQVMEKLEENLIYTRRYFYPSLNTLTYLNNNSLVPLSESISKRVICFPLYFYTLVPLLFLNFG